MPDYSSQAKVLDAFTPGIVPEIVPEIVIVPSENKNVRDSMSIVPASETVETAPSNLESIALNIPAQSNLIFYK